MKTEKYNVAKDVAVSEEEIDRIIDSHSAAVWYYNDQASDLEEEKQIAAAKVDEVYADLEEEYRIKLTKKSDGKVTDGQIKSAINRDKRYRKAVHEAIYAKTDHSKMVAITKALDHRKAMIKHKVIRIVQRISSENLQLNVGGNSEVEVAFRKSRIEEMHNKVKKKIIPLKDRRR